MSEEKHSNKKELISIQESQRAPQNNNSASPPDSKNLVGDITKKLNYAEQYTIPSEALPFEKFILEPFNTNEKTFWAYMQTYMKSKIESRQALSFYDYENLVPK
jgi:hypothetical protein